jgi:hypothetical protein
MEQLHQVLGYVALGGSIVGVAWCAWLAMRPDGPGGAASGRWLTWFGYALIAVTVAGAITGAVRQGSGGTPGALHPIVAALSVFALPTARYLGMLTPRRQAWVWLGGYAVTGLAVLALFQNG